MGLAAALGGLTTATASSAEQPREEAVTWERGALVKAETREAPALAPDATAREILTGPVLVANRSRELTVVVGALGAPAYCTMGAVLYDKSPGAGVGVTGGGAPAGAVVVWA